MSDEAILDVILQALILQARSPLAHGGGLIGKARAIVDALNLDGDLPLSSLSQKLKR